MPPFALIALAVAGVAVCLGHAVEGWRRMRRDARPHALVADDREGYRWRLAAFPTRSLAEGAAVATRADPGWSDFREVWVEPLEGDPGPMPCQLTILSAGDFARLLGHLENPPPLSPKLKAMAEWYNARVGGSDDAR